MRGALLFTNKEGYRDDLRWKVNVAVEEHVEIDGLPISYLAAGEGPPLVLLHGAGDNSLDWRWVMPTLCQARSDVRGVLPQEDRGRQVRQGGATVPQAARLRCCLQGPHGGFAGAFAQRRLTKRSREGRTGQVPRKLLPRTRGNRDQSTSR